MKELKKLLSHSVLNPSDHSISVHLNNGVIVHIYKGEDYKTSSGTRTRLFLEGFRWSATTPEGRLLDFEIDKYESADRMIRILIELGKNYE